MSKPSIRFLYLGDPKTDRRLKNFISLFSGLGYKVELIIASPRATNDESRITIEGAATTEIHLDHSRGAKMFLEYNRLLQNELANREPCDILFACELYSLKAAAQAKQNGKAKKLIFDARELYTELPTVASNPLKKLFWKRWEKRGLEQADLIIVTAPDDAAAIKQVHGFLPESIVIRNLPKREEFHTNDYLRKYYHILFEKKIFVYVGGMQTDRGLRNMIDTMTSLKDIAVFIMIGEGILKERLQEQSIQLGLQNVVFFHPAIDSEKIIEILSSADIGISLIEQHSKSYQFALPSKVFEYLLAGLPVISSPLKQVRDIFAGNEGVIFAEPDNPAALIGACKGAIALSNNANLRKQIHDDAYSNFTFEKDEQALKNYLSNNI